MVTTLYRGNLPLADGIGALVGPIQLPAQNWIDVQRYINASGPACIDRTGAEFTHSFTIFRQHADAAEATEFRATHNATVRGVADLVITWTLSTGESVTMQVPGAGWARVDPQLVGSVGSVTRYQVIGGPANVTREGAGETPFQIPFEPHASIAPLVVPAGFAAALNAGEDGFYFGAQLSGSLALNPGARALLLSLP